jgi:hypothetical protein
MILRPSAYVNRSVQGQEAKMSFEGDEKEGVVNIVAKLTVISSQPVLVCLYVYVFVRTLFQSLKFQVVQHAGTAIDAQIIDGVGLLICVLGQLKVKCNFSNCVPVCHIFFRQMMIHLTPSHRLLY